MKRGVNVTIDESLEFEELGAYDSTSGRVLVVGDAFPLGIAITIVIMVVVVVASARTPHSSKTQTLI